MRKLVSVVSVMFFCSALFAGLPRVAVMKLEDKTSDRGSWNGLGEGMADMLVSELVKTKKFNMIERAELEKVMEEQKLGLSGAVTPQTAAQIGKILGVEYMVIGSVSEYGTKESDLGAFGVGVKSHTASVGIDLRVIDTTSAQIVTAATGKCDKSTRALNISNADIMPTDIKMGSPEFSTTLIGKATRGAVEDAVSKITKELGGNWRGSIIKISDDRTVTINGGENAGVAVNDVYKVIRQGEDMVDPETGQSLGSEEKIIGEIKIIEVKPKYANAKIISGKDIGKSDRVEKK